MIKLICRCLTSQALLLVCALVLLGLEANGQCPGTTLTGGLQGPSKIIQTALGNLIVAENGTLEPNSGRISIVGLDGGRRSLLEGLPSGINSNGDNSGPSGLFLRGRTLYIVNGEGDATLPGPIPGTELPNLSPSSPIISSILALHFSARTEKITKGFKLSLADHQALKDGSRLSLSNGEGDKITLGLVVDFPNYVSNPLPFFPPNVAHSNPYGLIVTEEREKGEPHGEHERKDEDEVTLYVVDAGLNALLKVDIESGATSILTNFPSIPNPLFPGLGGPFIESVPTSIREFDNRFLVTLLRGFPFLPGNAAVMKVRPFTGGQQQFIGGLTSAIDVLPVRTWGRTHFLTLEISTNLLVGDPGRLQRFSSPAGPGTVISKCLIGPSAMVRDSRKGVLYVTEIFTGRIIKIPGL